MQYGASLHQDQYTSLLNRSSQIAANDPDNLLASGRYPALNSRQIFCQHSAAPCFQEPRPSEYSRPFHLVQNSVFNEHQHETRAKQQNYYRADEFIQQDKRAEVKSQVIHNKN